MRRVHTLHESCSRVKVAVHAKCYESKIFFSNFFLSRNEICKIFAAVIVFVYRSNTTGSDECLILTSAGIAGLDSGEGNSGLLQC